MSGDVWHLARFVEAQDERGTYERALAEVRSGLKSSHWMWFVFPQLAALGQSSMAKRYGIAGLDEAKAYLAHPVLGPRLLECVDAVLALDARMVDVFGPIDAKKLRSCVTLFRAADPSELRFGDVLDKFYDGVPDSGTIMAL